MKIIMMGKITIMNFSFNWLGSNINKKQNDSFLFFSVTSNLVKQEKSLRQNLKNFSASDLLAVYYVYRIKY